MRHHFREQEAFIYTFSFFSLLVTQTKRRHDDERIKNDNDK